MSRLILVLTAFVFAFGIAAAPAAADVLLLDYVGYDYEDPDLNPGTFGELGAGYVGIGFLPVLFSPLVADTSTFEYTYILSGLTVSNVTPVGSFLIIDYAGPGTIKVYEDSKTLGTPGVYGINPPNATAPSSFTDGTLFVEGAITGFQIILNTATNSGSYEAVFEAVGGSQLVNIPLGQRDGWTFAGLTGNELNKPEGYEHQVDGQILVMDPVPVELKTWGSIKKDYR